MLTQEKLKQILDYDSKTGFFTWKLPVRGVSKVPSKPAGHKATSGYIFIRVNGLLYRAHRLAWLYVYGVFPEYDIDHVDGNRSNNSIDNLRDVTRKENRKNNRKYKTNKSGVVGVYWYEPLQKWHAQIQSDGVKYHIGYFTDLETAKQKRKEMETVFNFHENTGKHNEN